MKYEMQTEMELQGVIRTIPEYITSPTLKGYEYSLTGCRSGKAYLMTDNPDLDYGLLRLIFSLYHKKYADIRTVTQTIQIYMPELAIALGNKSGCSRTAERIVTKLRAFTGVSGVIGNTDYRVFSDVVYEPSEKVLRVVSPYLSMLLKTLRSSESKYWFESLVSVHTCTERCSAAIENVFIITRAVAASSRPHIVLSANTLLDRNPVWKCQLMNDKNQHRCVKRVMECTAKILENDTRLKEIFHGFKISGLDFRLVDLHRSKICIDYKKRKKHE